MRNKYISILTKCDGNHLSKLCVFNITLIDKVAKFSKLSGVWIVYIIIFLHNFLNLMNTMLPLISLSVWSFAAADLGLH